MLCQPRVSRHHSHNGRYADTERSKGAPGLGVRPLPHVATPTTPITHTAQLIRIDLLVPRLHTVVNVRAAVVGLCPLRQAIRRRPELPARQLQTLSQREPRIRTDPIRVENARRVLKHAAHPFPEPVDPFGGQCPGVPPHTMLRRLRQHHRPAYTRDAPTTGARQSP